MRILLIEDEKILADSLCTLLTTKGFEVEAVYDGGKIWAQPTANANTFSISLPEG